MSIYIKVLCSCIICEKEFLAKGLHTHHERSHGTKEQKEKYSSGCHGKYTDENYLQKVRSPRHILTQNCICCGKEFTYEKIITHPIKNTCSRSCTATLTNKKRIENGYQIKWSDEQRACQSIRSKKLWQDQDYAKKIMSANKKFTSKNEVIIRNYFIEKFPEDEWTFGGSLKISDETITRDLYSKKLKICFEYDGIWHFKDIHGQLAKKQVKDMLLEKWCIENEYTLIRLDEDNYNKNFTITDLEALIYSISESTIIKIGERY